MRTAVVTGAARGIGLAVTKRFLATGYNVVMVDRDKPVLDEAAVWCEDNIPGEQSVMALPLDISDPEQARAIADRADKAFGRCHALVNNAGVADFGPIGETTFERWRAVMAVNLDGTFLVSQAMTALLRKAASADGDAAIVNIASISGLRASTLRVAYGTSKAAVIQLTLQPAVELGEFGIRANCVAPGPVDTKLAMAVHTPDIRAAYHDAIPLNRYGSEDEIAAAIAFLSNRDASYITGQVLASDGGFEATGIGLPSLRS